MAVQWSLAHAAAGLLAAAAPETGVARVGGLLKRAEKSARKSSGSPFLNHLVEFKQHLVQKVIPFDAEDVRIEKLQYSMWGIPAGSYDSKEESYAVNNYLSRVEDIFGRRRIEPARTP